MQKRMLGKTGIKVSEIAFGGVEIGMPYGIGISSCEDMITEKEAISLLHSAVDLGINYFDTARLYGNSEIIMGKAFKDRRDKIVLATKCRHLRDVKGKLPSDLELHIIIEKSIRESLEALQTGYVDIFMLHQADMEILDNEIIASVFDKLKEQGLCKAIGVSTYTMDESAKAIEKGYWNMIQLPFNIMDQRQSSLFHDAQQKGIGIVVRSVLLKGVLSERGKKLHPALKDVESHISKYEKVIKGTDMDLATLATKFALSFNEVSSVLIGIDKKEYLERSLKTANGVYLDKNRLHMVKQLAFPKPEFLNLPYWDKMNWLR